MSDNMMGMQMSAYEGTFTPVAQQALALCEENCLTCDMDDTSTCTGPGFELKQELR